MFDSHFEFANTMSHQDVAIGLSETFPIGLPRLAGFVAFLIRSNKQKKNQPSNPACPCFDINDATVSQKCPEFIEHI